MSSQQFFGITLLIGLALALYFLFPRSKDSPSRLKLGYRRNFPDLVNKGISKETAEAAFEEHIGMHMKPDPMAETKSLNVIFNYNGHSWDAFEVLGIPAGAKPAMVEEAYQKNLKSTDKASHDFIKTAYEAIKKTR